MRRRRKTAADVVEEHDQSSADSGAPAQPAVEGPRVHGPWDASELPVDEDDESRADLGALSVQGNPEVELRLQVEESSGQVQAVLLVAADGALELRPFAAPRNEELWDEIRPRLAEETKRRGGAVTEIDGPYGPALHMVVPGVTADGKKVAQPSTVLGIAGPRWLLRVSMFGRPAKEYDPEALLETTLRSVVVNRGTEPMAPGEPLPLVLPSGARRMGNRP